MYVDGAGCLSGGPVIKYKCFYLNNVECVCFNVNELYFPVVSEYAPMYAAMLMGVF